MATLIISDSAQVAALDAVTALINAGAGPGTIKFYDGTMPVDADDAVTTQTLLATLTFSDPAFDAAAPATPSLTSAAAFAITADTSVDATGTVSWARIADSDGNTVFDCDVTVTGAGGVITMASTGVTAGSTLEITTFTLSQPNGGA